MKKIRNIAAVCISAAAMIAAATFAYAADVTNWTNVAPRASVTFENSGLQQRGWEGDSKNDALFDLIDSTWTESQKGRATESTFINSTTAGVTSMTLDLKEAYNVKKVAIQTEYISSGYILSASNDNVNYVELDTFTQTDSDARVLIDNDNCHSTETEREISNDTSYRYYRFTPTQSNTVMKFYDVKLFVRSSIPQDSERILYDLSSSKFTYNDGSEVPNSAWIYDGKESTAAYANKGIDYVECDFGKVIPLSAIRLINRSKGLRIEASKDGTDYERIVCSLASDTKYDTGLIELDNKEYRYIRIYNLNKEWTRTDLNELYVYTVSYTESYWKNLAPNERWFNASIGCTENITDAACEKPVDSNQTITWDRRDRMTDGNWDKYGAVTKIESIVFDLGQTYKIGGFKCKYKYDKNALNGYEMYGSKDGNTWKKLYVFPAENNVNDTIYTVETYFEHDYYRYFKIYAPKPTWTLTLYIYELEILGITDYDGVLFNVAPGKDRGTWADGSEKVTDGIYNEKAICAKKITNLSLYNSEYVLDLGSEYSVKAVRTFFYDVNGQYMIFGSRDGENYTPIAAYAGTKDEVSAKVIDSGTAYIKPGKYRYIKILSTNNIINLAELEVYAEISDVVSENQLNDGKWSFTFNNNTEEDLDITPIIAQYDENGRLIDFSIKTESIYSGESLSKTYDFDSNKNIKCFIWNFVSGVKPFSPAITNVLDGKSE